MASSPPKDAHVVLLRGVNVGGKHKLPMRTFAALLEELGGRDVATYIQSGNAVLRAPAAVAKSMPAALEAALTGELGFDVPVVMRSASAFLRAAGSCPFPRAAAKELALGFLRDKPKAAAVRALDPDRSPPDEFVVKGAEVWLRLPNGAARSKLTSAWFDRGLGTTLTVRNLRTVGALGERLAAL